MAGKRRRTTQDEGPPRKSSRTCTAPARLGMLPHETLPPLQSVSTEGLLNDAFTLNMHPIGKFLEGYNALLSFMPPSGMKVGYIREKHNQVTDARDTVLSTLQETVAKVNILFGEMQKAIPWIMHPAVGYTRWYQRGDIFDLEPKTFTEIVEDYPIRDAPDFAIYLIRVSQARIESNITRNDVEWSEDMVSVLRCAQKALQNSPHPNAKLVTFQVTIKLLGRVLTEMPVTRWKDDTRELHYELRKDVSSITPLPQCPDFMDFAAAQRELWDSFIDRHRLEEKDKSDSRFEEDGPPRRLRGLHDNHSFLISELAWAAYREIRPRVLLAVGRRLPAELAELVLDKALDAEGIDFRPSASSKGWDRIDRL